jgi:hypothetical protein
MRVLRHAHLRLPAILLSLASFLAFPVHLASNGLSILILLGPAHSTIGSEKPACSCPMCRASKGASHHCACCEGKACTCTVSSEEEDSWLLLVIESATFTGPDEFYANLSSSPLESAFPVLTSAIALPVPTHPPRS